MDIGLYSAVGGMKVQAALQDTMSANLARANIPGSKRMITAFEMPTVKTDSLQGASSFGGNSVLPTSGLQSRSVIDFSQGVLDQTGAPTDLAVQGNAFFKVRETNGDISYTRNGQFHFDTDGTLVTSDGAQVLLDQDTPFKVDPKTSSTVGVTPDGKVRVDNEVRGSLALVHMTDPRTVLAQGPNGRFQLSNPADASKLQTGVGSAGAVRQGYLEEGNTDSVNEMVNLVQVVRSYEANQKMAMAQDSATGQIIAAASSGTNS